MKRAILYSFVALILAIILLYQFGFFYVSVSPHNYYRPNERESSLMESAMSKFRERVETGKFEEIQKEIAENDRDMTWQNMQIERIKDSHFKFGNPTSWDFFRSTSPRITSDIGKYPNEKTFLVEYLTKTEKKEFLEHFGWILRGNGEIRLSSYSSEDYVDVMKWRLEEREKQNFVINQYPNEIIIPINDRFIEIRY